MTTIQQITTQEKTIANCQAIRDEMATMQRAIELAASVLNAELQRVRKARLTKTQN